MGGRRSGTLNVAGIVGMAKALENSYKNIKLRNFSFAKAIRDMLEDALSDLVTRIVVVIEAKGYQTPF